MTKLVPAKNLRPKTIRVCATCQLGFFKNGTFCCQREGGIQEDIGDKFQWQMVCDGWTGNRQNIGRLADRLLAKNHELHRRLAEAERLERDG